MGIFGALTPAVTGLRAQSFALENISGNIANSQTTAFKRVDTSFEDLIPDFPINKQLAGSVIASSRATNPRSGRGRHAGFGRRRCRGLAVRLQARRDQFVPHGLDRDRAGRIPGCNICRPWRDQSQPRRSSQVFVYASGRLRRECDADGDKLADAGAE
jgi:hypothetical protein